MVVMMKLWPESHRVVMLAIELNNGETVIFMNANDRRNYESIDKNQIKCMSYLIDVDTNIILFFLFGARLFLRFYKKILMDFNLCA